MRTPRLVGPWLLLLAGAALAVVTVATDHLRAGGYLLAGTLAATAALRAVLPVKAAGALVVRSKLTDVVLLSGAAVAAAVLSATLKLTA